MTLTDRKLTWWLSISAGLYIALTFNLVEPFGITITEFNPIYHALLASYGIIAAVTVLAVQRWLLPIWLGNEATPRWQGLVLWMVVLVIVVSLSNWLYSLFIKWLLEGWRNFYVPVYRFSELMPQFLAIYSLWGLLCVANLFWWIRQPEASSSEQRLTLLSDNPNDSVRLKAMQLVCLKTCDNYLEVYYLDESDALRQRLIRSSMSRMEQQLNQPQFYRCHQSWLINLAYVKGLKKTQNGHSLEMAFLDFDVAISRKHLKHMTSYLVS